MNNIGMATSDWRGRKDVTLDPFQGESFNEDSLCKIEEQGAGERHHETACSKCQYISKPKSISTYKSQVNETDSRNTHCFAVIFRLLIASELVTNPPQDNMIQIVFLGLRKA